MYKKLTINCTSVLYNEKLPDSYICACRGCLQHKCNTTHKTNHIETVYSFHIPFVSKLVNALNYPKARIKRVWCGVRNSLRHGVDIAIALWFSAVCGSKNAPFLFYNTMIVLPSASILYFCKATVL